MDNEEFKKRMEEINDLLEKEDYAAAMEIVDNINWKKVKSAKTLSTVAEIYVKNKRYKESMELYLLAYHRAGIGKSILIRLVDISIMSGSISDAEDFYKEFKAIAPNDSTRYILEYKILKAKNAPITNQISVLERYNDREFTEEWAYELASLYYKAGEEQKCIDICNKMILWFYDGEYVVRAMDLKKNLNALTEDERIRYESDIEIYNFTKEDQDALRENLDETEEKEENSEETIDHSIEENLVEKSEELESDLEESGDDLKKSEEKSDMNSDLDDYIDEDIEAAIDEEMEAEDISEIQEEEKEPEIKEESDPKPEEKSKGLFSRKKKSNIVRENFSEDDDEDDDFDEDFNEDEFISELEGNSGRGGVGKDFQNKIVRGLRDIIRGKKKALSDDILDEEDMSEQVVESGDKEQTNEIPKLEDIDDDFDDIDLDRILEKQLEEEEKKEEETEDLEESEEKSEEVEEELTEEESVEEEKEEANYSPYSDDSIAIDINEIMEIMNDKKREKEKEQENKNKKPEEKIPEFNMEDTILNAATEQGIVLGITESEKEVEEPSEEKAEEESSEEINEVIEEAEEKSEDITDEAESEDELEEEFDDNEDELEEEFDENESAESEDDSIEEDEVEDLEEEEETKDVKKGGLNLSILRRLNEKIGRKKKTEEPKPEEENAEIKPPVVSDSVFQDVEKLEEEAVIDNVFVNSEVDDEDADIMDEIAVIDVPRVTEKEIDEATEDSVISEENKSETEDNLMEEEELSEEEFDENELEEEIIEEENFEMTEEQKMEMIMDNQNEFDEERDFTEKEKEQFKYFVKVPGMKNQIINMLSSVKESYNDKTSKTGNIIVMGANETGKTSLISMMIPAICSELNIEATKVAYIFANQINGRNIAKIVQKLSGGFLVIEEASKMDNETVDELNKAMEFRTDGMIVILEDDKIKIRKFLIKFPKFARKFTSMLNIPVFTNDELVEFACYYTKENGYFIDQLGMVSLYKKINKSQKADEPLNLGNVEQIIQEAIENTGKKKLFSKRKTTEDGLIILGEKDFN